MGHWEWNLASSEFTFMADEMYSLVGVSPREWKGTYEAFLATVDTTDLHSVEAAFNEALANGTTEVIYKIRRDDGAARWARMHAEVVRDSSGQPERVVGITLDITSYIAAKQELSHSRQYLLAITDNMAEGMIATEPNGTITFANAAAGQLLGRNATDLIGSSALDSFRIRRENGHLADAEQATARAVWEGDDSLNVAMTTC